MFDEDPNLYVRTRVVEHRRRSWPLTITGNASLAFVVAVAISVLMVFCLQ